MEYELLRKMFSDGSQLDLDLLELSTTYRCSHPRRVVSRAGRRPAEPRDAHVFSCCLIPRVLATVAVVLASLPSWPLQYVVRAPSPAQSQSSNLFASRCVIESSFALSFLCTPARRFAYAIVFLSLASVLSEF